MSIKELVAKIKSGEVKSYDVVKSYVDTINKKEDKIDAFLMLEAFPSAPVSRITFKCLSPQTAFNSSISSHIPS